MSERRRARSDSGQGWDRARRAYVELLGARDPAAPHLATGAIDRRLGFVGAIPDDATVLLSGPEDLVELRRIVESALGVGTWPVPPESDGRRVRDRIELERPAAAVALLLAMEGLIEIRSPWGRWRTAVDTMAARVRDLDAVTVDLRIVEPTV